MPAVELAQIGGMRLKAGRKLPEPAGRGRARYPNLDNAGGTEARGWTVLLPRQRTDMAPAPARGGAAITRDAMRTWSPR